MPNEADTCRRYVVPRLQAAGWENAPCRITEQVTFTDGRIVVTGQRGRRRPGKRADYILRYRSDLAIAVVEAKSTYATPRAGLQQAKEYAEILGLKFAYATNGHGIIEFDFVTGLERELDAFPTPEQLWARLTATESLSTSATGTLLAPAYHLSGKSPRYYQEIAINRSVQAIAQGCPRILLTMATAGNCGHHDGTAQENIGDPGFFTLPTGTFSSTTRWQRRSLPLLMLAGRSKTVERFRVEKCILRRINRSHATRIGPDFIVNSRLTFLT